MKTPNLFGRRVGKKSEIYELDLVSIKDVRRFFDEWGNFNENFNEEEIKAGFQKRKEELKNKTLVVARIGCGVRGNGIGVVESPDYFKNLEFYPVNTKTYSGQYMPEEIGKNWAGGSIFGKDLAYVLLDNIKLISRGNLYNHLKGNPLHFDNVIDEAVFYMSIGHAKIFEPLNLSLGYAVAEVYKNMKKGECDGYLAESCGGRPRQVKFIDKEVSKRVAKFTRQGLEPLLDGNKKRPMLNGNY